MNMVGAASRELEDLLGSKVVMEAMALLVRWIGDDGTNASPNAKRVAKARAVKRTMVMFFSRRGCV